MRVDAAAAVAPSEVRTTDQTSQNGSKQACNSCDSIRCRFVVVDIDAVVADWWLEAAAIKVPFSIAFRCCSLIARAVW